MKKKAAAKRTSVTKKKKQIAKEVKTASGTAEKTATKKRKSVVSPAEKTTAGTVEIGKKKVKKVKAEEKQKAVKKKKISPKTEKKKRVKTEGKSEKKTTEAKVAAKGKAGKDATGHPGIRKTREKVPLKRKEEVRPKGAGKAKVTKPLAPKAAKQVKVRVTTKAGTVEKEKKTLGPIKEKVVSTGMMEIVEGGVVGEPEKKERPQGIAGRGGKAEEIRVTAKARRDETGRGQEAKEVTVAQKPGAREESAELAVNPPMARAVLPDEYGENAVTLMTVDPHRLFAFWEVREETLKVFKGEVDVRVYDVTGVDFDMMDANSYLDIRTDDRIGKCYIGVNPGREYIADIGIIFDGIFIAIARSVSVSTPRGTVSGVGLLSYDLGETGFRTGY